nr:hypothetical protein CFP56_77572 [Quercus suber]
MADSHYKKGKLGYKWDSGLRISFLGFGISLICLGSSIFGLRSGILKLETSLWTLGLGQGLDLLALALILWPRTTLASLLTLSHLNPLTIVTNLAKPFGDLKRRKRAWVIEGCSEEIGAGAAAGGSATGTSRMFGG